MDQKKTHRRLLSELFDICAEIAYWKKAHFEYYPIAGATQHDKDVDKAVQEILAVLDRQLSDVRKRCRLADIPAVEIEKALAYWKGKLAE